MGVCCPRWCTPPHSILSSSWSNSQLQLLPCCQVCLQTPTASLNPHSLTPKPNFHFQQWCQQSSKQDDCTKEGCIECVVGVECLLANGWQEGQGAKVLLPLNLHTRWLIVTLDTKCVGGEGGGSEGHR